MTSEQLASVWSSSTNTPTPAETRSLTAAFFEEIDARRRRVSLGLVSVGVAFAALTVASVALVTRGDGLPAEPAWTIAAMNALVWGGWVVVLVRHASPRRPAATTGAPVREALRQSLAQRRAYAGYLRVIAIGLLLTPPLVALSLDHLVEAGRIAADELPRRVAFALGAYGVALACLGADYFGRTAREIQRLSGLLAECDRDAAPAAETPRA